MRVGRGGGGGGGEKACFSLVYIFFHLNLGKIFNSIQNGSKGSESFVQYSRTSLIWTPKGQSKVSVLERCLYERGHYDDVTFITPLTV